MTCPGDASDGREDRRKEVRVSAGRPTGDCEEAAAQIGPAPCSHTAALLLYDFLFREPGPLCSN